MSWESKTLLNYGQLVSKVQKKKKKKKKGRRERRQVIAYVIL